MVKKIGHCECQVIRQKLNIAYYIKLVSQAVNRFKAQKQPNKYDTRTWVAELNLRLSMAQPSSAIHNTSYFPAAEDMLPQWPPRWCKKKFGTKFGTDRQTNR